MVGQVLLYQGIAPQKIDNEAQVKRAITAEKAVWFFICHRGIVTPVVLASSPGLAFGIVRTGRFFLLFFATLKLRRCRN